MLRAWPPTTVTCCHFVNRANMLPSMRMPPGPQSISSHVQQCCRIVAPGARLSFRSSSLSKRLPSVPSMIVGLNVPASRARWHSSSIVQNRRRTPAVPTANHLRSSLSPPRWFSLTRWRPSQEPGYASLPNFTYKPRVPKAYHARDPIQHATVP